MNTMNDILTKLKAKKRLHTMYAVGLFFLVLVCLYTFSHNANLVVSGTSIRFQTFGLVAAVAGELYILVAYTVAVYSTGGQKIAAVVSDLGMLAILMANTVVDYANVTGKIPASAQWLLEVYAAFGAPTLIGIGISIGVHFLLFFDYAVQQHSAELAAGVALAQVETAAAYTAAEQMRAEMDNPAHTDKVTEAAGDAVATVIDLFAAKQRRRRVI